MIRGLIVLALGVLLGGCTMLYTREYTAETPQAMSAAENEQIFRSFRDFLYSKGLRPHDLDLKTASFRVAFRIGGSNAGFALRKDWEDILELSHSKENGFQLRLMRIVHHPADFSEDYLRQFVEQTEGFLREATNRPIRLKLVPRERT